MSIVVLSSVDGGGLKSTGWFIGYGAWSGLYVLVDVFLKSASKSWNDVRGGLLGLSSLLCILWLKSMRSWM